MRVLHRFARLFAGGTLGPVFNSDGDPLIGGQAVMEGVMMRTPQSYCVAVRKPNGEITTKEETATRLSQRSRFWALPLLRGCGILGQSMTLGVKALNFSASQAVESEETDDGAKSDELSGWVLGLNIAVSVGFFIVMYKLVPLLATNQLQEWVPALDNQVGFSFAEGGIRIAIFLSFLLALSQMKDIRRVFEYHGAEHKVVYNYESGQDLTIENAQRFTTLHPRCGTSFLMVVMLVAIAVYALVPFEGFVGPFIARVALLPLIAGISFEIIRYTAKRQRGVFMLMARPGLWLQRVTTKQPDDSQVEVAIHALKTAFDFERRAGGNPVVA
ncbi:MAG: DUF1385 domain-containing protein [Bryobacterales bacterium]|nr:DUF1385 domain-containing protein [Bryobacterales bacterium]